jgi:pimeloyl-ACP methyl ester carboxylesterase
MSKRPIVLLHGYSAEAKSMMRWRDELVGRGYDATTLHVGQYVSLANEVTIKDIAEGFDRALRLRAGLEPDEPFDAIVHSTGGLVIREWLATYATRTKRLKRLIGLAPAMFGSPLAHKGRSWMGALFKGDKDIDNPDFMEAGRLVLSGLELGSSYSWRLAERDLVERPIYDDSPDTPFPFIFIGLKDYGFLKRLFVDEPGSDGTVRWAAAGLNTRKIEIDLTREPGADEEPRVTVQPWAELNIPLVLVPDVNHGTIVSDPPKELVDMVSEALAVEDKEAYGEWVERYSVHAQERWRSIDKPHWQQFVTRAVDERGDPVRDYYLEVGSVENGEFVAVEDFSLEAHPFTDDTSYRCFHINLSKLEPERHQSLQLRLTALSGSTLVAYHGYGSETFRGSGEAEQDPGVWDAQIDLTKYLADSKVEFFFPFTTTLVEIRLNREPMPPAGVNKLLKFVDGDG